VVSATTRAPRPGEVDGVNYRFLEPDEFARLEEAGEFLETAEVHGNRYGTPRAPVEDAIRAGRTVILEIDVQGAGSVRSAMPEAVLVFVEPPSADALRARLEARKTETPEAREERLRNATTEMEAAGGFDHRIVNDRLEEAVDALVRILDEASPTTRSEP
jgi:guanylate kinase